MKGKKTVKKPARSEINRINKIIEQLKKDHPDADIELKYKNPHELVIATILSAQCTDVRVNQVTETLFKKYKSVEDFAEADLQELESDIRPTGFFHNKAKNIQGCCRHLLADHKGKVPETMEQLIKLPGIGRKTANVILGNAFGVPGVVVDTHVKRISNRLALTGNSDPVKIEFDLMPLVPEEEWTLFSHLIIFHGRRICKARNPNCTECNILKYCPYGKKAMKES